MPDRSFRVRHYECDAYGHLNNTAYLHYLEEIEIDAGIAVGQRLRHIDIRYIASASFGDTLAVTAEDGSGGGREYSYVRAGNDERVAGAVATWTPASDPASGTDRVPAPPPQPASVFTRRRRIDWQDIDAGAAVSPAALAGMAEDCGLALCAAYGWPLDRCTESGFAMLVRRHQISCPGIARLGDELEIATWASDLGRASAIRHYVITREGDAVARFRSHYVWVDADTMRPIRIPEQFLADFSPNFSPPPAR